MIWLWLRHRTLRRELFAAYHAAQRKEALDATVRFLSRLRYFDVQYLTDNILNQLGCRDHFTLRATTVEQLGDALRAARTGPVGLYRELAITGYQAALAGGSQNPSLHLKIAAAYLERHQGTAEDNAKQAEVHLNTFLGLLEGPQYERRGIAYNLRGLARGAGLAFANAARLDFQSALEAFEKANIPDRQRRRADVLTNLAKLEADHSGHELSIRYYREALSLYRSAGSPSDVALTQRNLAATLLELARPGIDIRRAESSDLVEESIQLLLAARTNADQRTSPHASAVIALNLGMAYALRIQTDNMDKFRLSRQEYGLAADLFRQLHEPINERRALIGAGGIAYELADWSDAEKRFAQAIDLLEGEWRQTLTASSRLQLVRRHAELYGFTLLSAVGAQNLDEALRVLEYGRSRLLRETLYSNETATPAGISNRLWRILQDARKKRTCIENELLGFRRPEAEPMAESDCIANMRRELDRHRRKEEEVTERIRVKSPKFLPVAHPELPAALRDLARNLDAQLWIVKPTRKGTALFVVTNEGDLRQTILSPLTTDQLRLLLFGNSRWLDAYKKYRDSDDEQAKRFWWTEWIDSMEPTLNRLWDLIIAPCLDLGNLSRNVDQVQAGIHAERSRIYVLAGGMLDLLPIHATFRSYGQRKIHLIDVADVGYFSSGTLLRASFDRQRGQRAAERLLMFRDQGAAYSGWLQQFGIRLYGARASHLMDLPDNEHGIKQVVEALNGPAVAIFSCHAKAHAQDPLRSGLFQPNSDRPCVSLGALLRIKTDLCRLVVLNACETALAEIDDPADECLSLANAFLATGAGAVVGTQWPADALSAALWCAHFLEGVHAGSGDALSAACSASIWLRDSTAEARIALLQRCPIATTIDRHAVASMDFTHPFNWANHKYHGA